MNEQKDITAEDLMLEQLAPGEEFAPVEPKKDISINETKMRMQERMAERQIQEQLDAEKKIRLGIEVAVVAGSFLLAWIALSTIQTLGDLPEAITLLACLAPTLTGLGIRLFKEQLPFREAVSGCKLHMAFSGVLLIIGFFYVMSVF